MRGKGLSNRPECPISGITPAYAGKRATLASVVGMAMDHPRLCGEKRQWQTASRTEAGSPPPMRGKVNRLIQSGGCAEDHPRLCGEKVELPVFVFVLLGSPPPMRGKGSKRSGTTSKHRITPAYAGKRFFVIMPNRGC